MKYTGKPAIPPATVAKFDAACDAIGTTSFAKMLGVGHAMVCHMRTGARRPSLELACRIQRVTSGKIKATDWVAEEPEETIYDKLIRQLKAGEGS